MNTNPIIEQSGDQDRSPAAALQELGELSRRTVSRLTELNLRVASLGIESSVKHLKLLSEAGDYERLWHAESELVSGFGSRLLEIGCQAADALTATRQELLNWITPAAGAQATGSAVKAAPREARVDTRKPATTAGKKRTTKRRGKKST